MTLEAIRDLVHNKDKDRALFDYIKLLRMNPEHPENHNIRIPNVESNMMMKKTEDGWSNVQASPNGLWDVAVLDFFGLKSFATKVLKSGEESNLLAWIELTEKKIQKSSYQDAGQLIDIIDDLKKHFAEFTRLVYMTQQSSD